MPVSFVEAKSRSPKFDVAAVDVLASLRTSLANVLASVGGIRKPADLQKSLKLDWTLSWQLFQVAGAGSSGTALGAGANVPSRTSLKKFLDSAHVHGVDSGKVKRVWTNFELFEQLVEVHAGDRTTFNSMVSAAAGMNDDWLAADAQHRRNAYRAMSHVFGMQAKTKHICGLYSKSKQGQTWDMGVVVGYVGLRMLRELPNPLVFRNRLVNPAGRVGVRRSGLGDHPDLAGGYLLPNFCSHPLPPMVFREMDAGWIASELENPDVGNLGACTLRFGTAYEGHPIPGQLGTNDRVFDGDVVVDKPVEVLINDSIVQPGLMQGAKPLASIFLGNNHSDGAVLPGDIVPVLGSYAVEFLGHGPDVLATPDVPDYPDLMRMAADKLHCDISNYEVWRLRVEFPLYQSTVRAQWTLPQVDAKA